MYLYQNTTKFNLSRSFPTPKHVISPADIYLQRNMDPALKLKKMYWSVNATKNVWPIYSFGPSCLWLVITLPIMSFIGLDYCHDVFMWFCTINFFFFLYLSRIRVLYVYDMFLCYSSVSSSWSLDLFLSISLFYVCPMLTKIFVALKYWINSWVYIQLFSKHKKSVFQLDFECFSDLKSEKFSAQALLAAITIY